MNECGFLSCPKCTTLMGDADMGEAMHVVGTGYRREVSVTILLILL